MWSGKDLTICSVAVITTALDQLTKVFARALLKVGQPVPVIPGFFDLELSYNEGAAFGILPDWTPLLIILGLGALYAFFRLGKNLQERDRILLIGLGIMMGGAAGNLIDRIFLGNVTDFLSLHVTIVGKTYAWPTFNLADVGIVAGAVMIFISVYIREKNITLTNKV